MSEAEDVLRLIARRVAAKPARVSISSANIDEPVRLRVRYSRGERQVTIYAAVTRLSVEVPVPNGRLHLAINRPDRIALADRALEPPIHGLPWPVFADRALGAARVRTWLTPARITLLRALELEGDEAAFVFGNVVQCVCRPNRDHIGLAELLLTIADEVPVDVGAAISLSELPAELRPLARYFAVWAIPDDDARSERIEQATPAQKQELLAAIHPHLQCIDEFLVSCAGKSMAEAAVLLGALAKAAAAIRAHEA